MPGTTIDADLKGKKVFFLYPPSVIQEQMVSEIIKNEYEVYLINDHTKALRLLQKYPSSILFVNIDTHQKEVDWESYIKALQNDKTTQDVRVGILTYNNDKNLAEKYLMELMVPCGFIKLTLGLKDSTDIILKALEANEAKGRRKYVRTQCFPNSAAHFNVIITGDTHTGNVHDISSVGMSCQFDKWVSLKAHSLLESIQLRLKGTLCMVNGIVMGTRNEQGNVLYVIMFDPKLHPDTRSKIRNFIYLTAQAQIDTEA